MGTQKEKKTMVMIKYHFSLFYTVRHCHK